MLKQLIGLMTAGKPADKGDKESEITFCESCGDVCGSACRSEALLDRAKVRSISYQTGVISRF